ncbi:MAG: hypothetical protein HY323_02120 [Betaproteobacteria bacterium]|nr:hypothetical protein [Betaproteobacteria bacterium]
MRTLIIILIAVVIGGYYLISGKRSVPANPQRNVAIDNAERVKRGPYIERSKEISETETVRILVVPHPWGSFFDTTCVIYTHREFKAATMQCPKTDTLPPKDDFTPLP